MENLIDLSIGGIERQRLQGVEAYLQTGHGRGSQTECADALTQALADKLLANTGKYLEALHNDAFDPDKPTFDAKWTSEDRPAVSRQRLDELVDSVLQQCTSIPITSYAKASFIAFLSALLIRAESWRTLNLERLLTLPGLLPFKLKVSQLLVRIAGLFALPQLPPPHPILLARNWHKFDSSGCGLTIGLWLQIASFFEPLPGKSWWETATHPLLFLIADENDIMIGCKVLTPPRVDGADFFGQRMTSELVLNDVDVTRNPEHDSPDIQQRTAEDIIGFHRRGTLRGHPNSDMRLIVQSVGVYFRLHYKIPTLLVGSSNAGVCQMVGVMQSCQPAVFVDLAASLDPFALKETLADSQLLVLRLNEDCLAPESCEVCIPLLQDILMGRTCLQIVVAALDCNSVPIGKLQRFLPVRLREAVVFY